MRRKVKYNMSLYQKRYRYSGFKKEQEDVDITSLLDILVILLVFLIKNYSASPLDIKVIDSLDLVNSQSKEMGQNHTLVQVNKELEVFIEDKSIGRITESEFEKLFEKEIMMIGERLKVQRTLAAKEEKKKFIKKNDTVNFVIDQSVKYENINKLMDLVAKHNYLNYKFIVRTNES